MNAQPPIARKMKTYLISILLFLALAPALSHAGSAHDWIFQNPYPTSNTLLAVKFVTPKKGWIAGEHGTILYTEDGGETWEAQESGTEQDLKGISFIDEKQGWVVGNGGVIIHTEDGGRTWKPQGDEKVSFHKVFFVNDKDGWAGGDSGVLLHTQDGGKNWTKVSLGTGVSIAGIFFRNADTGWVLSGGTVYRTTDGGKNWEASTQFPVRVPRAGRITGGGQFYGTWGEMPSDLWQGDLFFIDEKKGWAVVGLWYIFHTDDGGATWKTQYSDSMTYSFANIFFTDSHRGCAVGSSILCTEDGGLTWEERLGVTPGEMERVEGFLVGLWGLSFGNKSIGWAVGIDGQIWKTEDEGKRWKIKSKGSPTYLWNIYFLDNRAGWAIRTDDTLKKNRIIRTDDGGEVWKIQKEFETRINLRFFFINPTKGWAVGWQWKQTPTKYVILNSLLLYTEDGGKTWVIQSKEIGSKLALLDVFFINPENGWVVGSNGLILHTKDGGKHWIQQKSGTKFRLEGVQFINDKKGWVVGVQGGVIDLFDDEKRGKSIILYTEDGGQHWNIQDTRQDAQLKDLIFVDKNSGWATGSTDNEDVLLLYTRDSGKTWSKKKIENISLDSACFVDKVRGALFIEKEQMLVTRDGGKTWNKQRKPVRKQPWQCHELFK